MSSNDNNDEIMEDELQRLYNTCLQNLKAGELRALQNDAKLRAINNTKSYDEFKDIVDAAHLKAITKQDKMNATTKNRLWNSAAHETEDIQHDLE